MKCKDCDCCHTAVYKRYHPELGFRNVGVFECWGVQEKFEIDDITQECPVYPAKREQESDCPYCNKNLHNGGFNTQAVHIRHKHIEYTYIDAKFCPNCGRKLEENK